MKKIIVNINLSQKPKAIKLLEEHENLSIFERDDSLEVEFFFCDSFIPPNILKKIEDQFGRIKLKKIRTKNWLLENKKDDIGIESEFFFISQGFLKKKQKKFYLQIPASNAFGTGSHESTFLALRSLEYLFKKNDFNTILDMGTGTGILSFAARLMTSSQVFAIDVDKNAEKCFLRNIKLNKLNNIFFSRNNGFKSKILKDKKFDLIVSNMLLRNHKGLIKKYAINLKKNGFVVISGILDDQCNQLLQSLYKFNFFISKKFTLNNWVSLILKKSGNL